MENVCRKISVFELSTVVGLDAGKRGTWKEWEGKFCKKYNADLQIGSRGFRCVS